MLIWLEALAVALAALILVIIIICILIRQRLGSEQQSNGTDHIEASAAGTELQQPGKRRLSNIFGRGSSVKSVFSWDDHPELITDAVENGWARFAFTNFAPSPSVRSSLFGSARVAGDYNINSFQVDMGWEIGQGSVDLMQKVRFSKINGSYSSISTGSAIRMALPLPGPPCSFPQEAYFEITILSVWDDHQSNVKIISAEGEKSKLIDQNISSSSSSNATNTILENLSCVKSGSEGGHLPEEVKISGVERERGEAPKISLGLGVVGSNKSPGSYPGSIGFNSNGSVYLSGLKLVFEDDEKGDWVQKGKIIGCGFDPRTRKVFFTVDSKLVRVINCKSDIFGMPLYPILKVNTNITILVNLGQSQFSYSPANSHRTPNPCFINPSINASTYGLSYEDSRELFSMGRIDGEWYNRNGTSRSVISTNSYTVNNNIYRSMEGDEESDADLFEIVLDRTRSPKIV